jgi:hypothetical protein
VLVLFAAGNNESIRPQAAMARRRQLADAASDGQNYRPSARARTCAATGMARQLPRALPPPRYNNAAFNATAGTAPGAFGLSGNANQIALFSDRGQVRTAGFANTRRVKPDLVAPGTNILSTRSQWVAQPPALPGPPPILDPFYATNSDSMLPPGLNRNLHQIMSGTSMATPVVAVRRCFCASTSDPSCADAAPAAAGGS